MPADPSAPPTSTRSPEASSASDLPPGCKAIEVYAADKVPTMSTVAQSSGTGRFRRVLDNLFKRVSAQRFNTTFMQEHRYVLFLGLLHLGRNLIRQSRAIDIHMFTVGRWPTSPDGNLRKRIPRLVALSGEPSNNSYGGIVLIQRRTELLSGLRQLLP